MQGEENIIPDL